MIPRPCRCRDESPYLNVQCPDVQGHRPWTSYPLHRRSIMLAAEHYHDEVMAGHIPIIVSDVERHVGTPPETKKPTPAPTEPGGGGQRQRVLVRAREMQPGDPWPGNSRAVAGLELGTKVTYARGVVSDVGTQVCTVCGAAVRVKDDGTLYRHPLRSLAPCAGTQGRGEAVPREVWSVVVRGEGWVAVWTDGKADGTYLDGQGKVTLAVLKRWLSDH